jgi:hypothetical protein
VVVLALEELVNKVRKALSVLLVLRGLLVLKAFKEFRVQQEPMDLTGQMVLPVSMASMELLDLKDRLVWLVIQPEPLHPL